MEDGGIQRSKEAVSELECAKQAAGENHTNIYFAFDFTRPDV